jgi:hypothetical protein
MVSRLIFELGRCWLWLERMRRRVKRDPNAVTHTDAALAAGSAGVRAAWYFERRQEARNDDAVIW